MTAFQLQGLQLRYLKTIQMLTFFEGKVLLKAQITISAPYIAILIHILFTVVTVEEVCLE